MYCQGGWIKVRRRQVLSSKLFSLSLKVYLQRQRLENLALRYGRTSPKVLAASKLLDKTILELQQMKAD